MLNQGRGIVESPSLRGSGLKSSEQAMHTLNRAVSLFTREWIEISFCGRCSNFSDCLPLYEGVDWNSVIGFAVDLCRTGLPLYEGVDWNCRIRVCTLPTVVSLFTREWIEIKVAVIGLLACIKSPSLRGSGLKSSLCAGTSFPARVSLFTREWIEIRTPAKSGTSGLSPSLRGSGLKFQRKCLPSGHPRSPSLRGSGLK